MRLLRRGLFVATALISCAACTLLTSLDGLSDGPASADAADGAIVTADGGDASTNAETSTPADGGDAAPWCQTHRGDASFCEDFDTPGQGLGLWDGFVLKGGGTTALSTVAPSSAPSSLRSDLPPIAAVDGGGARSEAFVYSTGAKSSNDVTVELEVLLEKVNDTGTQLQIAKIIQQNPLDPTQDGWEVGLAVKAGSRKLVVFQFNYFSNAYGEPYTYPTPLAKDAWVRLRLHLHAYGTFDGRVDVDVDGVRAVTDIATQPAYAFAPSQLSIGAVYTQPPHNGWTVRNDNVIFDVK